ncbi:MAG TPA: WbqC family protein, partial [Lacipirellulaceae bacterium]|nr:WbqC family protein [Lacipirellulaceae bacterium]
IRDLRSSDNGRWRKKHWKSLEMNYTRAPGFSDYAGELRAVYWDEAGCDAFLPLVLRLIDYQLKVLGIRTKIVLSSTLGISGSKSNLVRNLCRSVGAKTYLSGPFGRDYLDMETFKVDGIEIVFHEYEPQPYRQVWPGFEPAMSALDALFCNGAKAAADIMRAGRKLFAAANPKEALM